MINFKITRLTVLIIALFFTASCINNNYEAYRFQKYKTNYDYRAIL